MGSIPSRDAPPTFFSLRYGTHEVGLIPLVHRYFHRDNKELRQQFIRVRNDPSVRYNFMRPQGCSVKELPPATFTEEKLDKFLDVIDKTLYDTTEAMLADEEAPLRPVPCAVCFVYLNGREGSDCFSFFGRRINVIGHFGCYTSEETNEDQPYLYARKTILKAAGDRTLERVVTLAARVYKEEFTRAVMAVRPTLSAPDMFQRRVSLLPFIAKSPWNSYPTLKFLYDTSALFWAVNDLHCVNDAPLFSSYEVKENGEGGLVIEVSGKLLVRFIAWVCRILGPSVSRGQWEQYMLDDFYSQKKEKALMHWLVTSPEVKSFMGGEEFTARVQNHLTALLGEVVRARETPAEDLTLWREEREYSHDHKLYRIFDSPICGPFLTTVKSKVGKKGVAGGSDTGSDASSDRKASSSIEHLAISDDSTQKKSGSSSNGMSMLYASSHTQKTQPLQPPPKYQDALISIAPLPFLQQLQINTCPMQMPPVTASLAQSMSPMLMLPPSAPLKPFPTHANSTPTSATFLPVFQGSSSPSPLQMQPIGMPYVMLASSGQDHQHPNHMVMSSISSNNNVTPAAAVAANNGNVNHIGGGVLYDSLTTKQSAANSALLPGGSADHLALIDVTFPQTLSNYVLLPDGRIGLLNNPAIPTVNFWS